MSSSVLDWCVHFNLCSPEGRQITLRPCGDGEDRFLVEVNRKPLLHCHINKFKSKKKRMWEVNFMDGRSWAVPDATYALDKLDDLMNHILEGFFEGKPNDRTQHH